VSSAAEALVRQALRDLPAKWRDELRRATIVGDLRQIGEAIRAIGNHGLEAKAATALTAWLEAMATNFEYDRILAALGPAEGIGG
jgi:hypothetical protein